MRLFRETLRKESGFCPGVLVRSKKVEIKVKVKAELGEAKPHVVNPDHSGTGFLTHRRMIIGTFRHFDSYNTTLKLLPKHKHLNNN